MLRRDFTFNMCCSTIFHSPATYTRFSLAFPIFLSLWKLSRAIECINFSSLISLIEATGEKSRKKRVKSCSSWNNKKKKMVKIIETTGQLNGRLMWRAIRLSSQPRALINRKVISIKQAWTSRTATVRRATCVRPTGSWRCELSKVWRKEKNANCHAFVPYGAPKACN